MPAKFCPGAANISGTPTLKIKKCPQCGGEVELFSTDTQMTCSKCGFVVFNDITSCIRWCSYARECVGDEMYEKLMQGETPDSPLYHKNEPYEKEGK
jgi:ribosomal protein S27AE